MVKTLYICFEGRNKQFPVVAVSMMPTLNQPSCSASSPQTFCDSERYIQLNWRESYFAVFPHYEIKLSSFLDYQRMGISYIIKPRIHLNHINRNEKV